MSDPFDWTPARWITVETATCPPPRLPLFRRTFTLHHPITNATIRLAGLGHFELCCNGQKIGDNELEQPWSAYDKRIYYTTHDPTPHLNSPRPTDARPAPNTLAVLLGNGMYDTTSPGRYKKFKRSFGPPRLILHLTLTHPNHPPTTIVSDEHWQTAPGPLTFSDIYGGEDHDARLEPPSWDTPAFDATNWTSAIPLPPQHSALSPQHSPPIRVTQTLPPINILHPRPGITIYDLGQNFAGRPHITVPSAEGATTQLTPGELLDPETGLVIQKNTGSPVHYTYTARGGSTSESWHPRFAYTGFRYLQIEGNQPLQVEGQFLHADLTPISTWECSNNTLNRIHHLIRNAIRSNLNHVLTDCPHREKLGWLEQSHLMFPAIAANFDVRAYYHKLCTDVRDAQHDNGLVPTTAPQYTTFAPPWDVFNDSPEWGLAAVFNPWLVHKHYGDTDILRDNYDCATRYLAYLKSKQTPEALLDHGLGDWYDTDLAHPSPPGFSKLTPRSLTATALYAHALRLMSEISPLTTHRRGGATSVASSQNNHATHYASEHARVLRAFTQHHLNPANFATASQTALAVPLALNLAPADLRPSLLEHLIANIRANDNHTTAGDIGFPFVLKALAEAGRSDIIFDLLANPTPPSYAAQLNAGATTLTEAWDADPAKSQNHLMLGHAEAWFHQHLAGLRSDHTAEHPYTLHPTPVGDVTWLKSTYTLPEGPLNIEWQRTPSAFTLRLTTPTRLPVQLPDHSTHTVPPGPRTLTCPL